MPLKAFAPFRIQSDAASLKLCHAWNLGTDQTAFRIQSDAASLKLGCGFGMDSVRSPFRIQSDAASLKRGGSGKLSNRIRHLSASNQMRPH